jgi:hypothetical protein
MIRLQSIEIRLRCDAHRQIEFHKLPLERLEQCKAIGVRNLALFEAQVCQSRDFCDRSQSLLGNAVACHLGDRKVG